MSTGEEELRSFIAAWLAEQLGQEVGVDANFAALGMDSLDAVELTDALADKLGTEEVEVSLILEHNTPEKLALHLAREISEGE